MSDTFPVLVVIPASSPSLQRCFPATFGNVHFHFIHQRQNANTPALQMVRGEGEEGRKEGRPL